MVSQVRNVARIPVWATVLVFAAVSAFSSEQAPAPYRLGPEDVVCITVLNHQEFSGDFFIPQDGIVDLPAVGRVNVGGKTLGELATCITESLKKRLREPEVAVTLKMPRMQRVYVLGAVAKPGLYDLKPGWRITEALAAAGGLIPQVQAAECTASVLRVASGERRVVTMPDVLRGGEEANLLVASGDVVTIEPEERLPVYVMGKVKTPGMYQIRKESAGVMEALTVAGGVLEDSALSRVAITHVNGSSEVVDLTSAVMNGEQKSGPKLLPGDLVVVPEVTARIAVLGQVNQPGFFTLRDGQKLLLSDALGLAKGANGKEANIAAVVVIRTANGKQEKLVFNLHRFFKNGDPASNPEVLSGDVVYVPAGKKLDWSIVFSAISAVGWIINPFVK